MVLSHIRNSDGGGGVGLWNFDVLEPVIAVVYIMFFTSDQTSLWIYEPNVWSSYVDKCSGLTLFIYICFFILLPPSVSTHTFWNSCYVHTVSHVCWHAVNCHCWLLNKNISSKAQICNTCILQNQFSLISFFMFIIVFSLAKRLYFYCMLVSFCMSVNLCLQENLNTVSYISAHLKETISDLRKWFFLLLLLNCGQSDFYLYIFSFY